MFTASIPKSLGTHWVVCGVLLAGFLIRPCFAQTGRFVRTDPRTRGLDAFGNAMRPYGKAPLSGMLTPRDRPRQLLRRAGPSAQQNNQRDWFTGYLLSGDLLSMKQQRLRDYRSPTDELPSTMRQAFGLYGGFGKRGNQREPTGMATILTRRRALVEATSFNAPVHRALWRTGRLGIALPSTGASLPPDGSVTGQQDLGVSLRDDVGVSMERLLRSGWSWFREGSYRRAARQFELCATLDPDGFEPRFAELLCYVSMGAVRTTFAVLDGLNAHDPDPFAHELMLTDRHVDSEGALVLRNRTQRYAQASGSGARAVALHLLVLWYLGERQEAMRTADSAAAMLAATAYADWPAKMRSASSARVPADVEP